MSTSDFVCLYVDNSNVFHEGQRFAEQQKSEDRYAFRIHFRNFIELATNGRHLQEVVWAGSIPPPEDSVWKYLEQQLGPGKKPDLIPRSTSGENNTVDHLIQLRMYRHARKYRQSPGTIVLCTGDGKGYSKEEGFLYDLESHADDGWAIGVLSWNHSCHGQLRKFAQDKGVYIPLDDHYESISFIQGGRRAKPLGT
jgi:hypothetical protein